MFSRRRLCATAAVCVVLGLATSACDSDETLSQRDMVSTTPAIQDASVIVSATTERVDGTRFVRVFADVDEAEFDEIAEQSIEVERSRYTRADYEAMQNAVRAIPLTGDEASGTSYDPVDDVFVVAGSLDEARLAEALSGYEYRFVYDPDGGRDG